MSCSEFRKSLLVMTLQICGGLISEQDEIDYIVFDQELFENINQSMVKCMTRLLGVVIPCLVEVRDTHKTMKSEIERLENDDEQIPTRKLKQYSKLNAMLPLWASCIDVIEAAAQCAFHLVTMPYKLWSKMLECASKTEHKMRSNQFGEALSELLLILNHCKTWMDRAHPR